jgi:hypothetical protein
MALLQEISGIPSPPDGRWKNHNLRRLRYLVNQDLNNIASRDGSFARGRGYPRIPDQTGTKICPRVWVRAPNSARGQPTGSNFHPRIYPQTETKTRPIYNPSQLTQTLVSKSKPSRCLPSPAVPHPTVPLSFLSLTLSGSPSRPRRIRPFLATSPLQHAGS